MLAHRATILAAGAASLLLLAGTPAGAQMDQTTAVNILRECARIDDASARLACYDNNIRNVGGTVRATVPGQVQVQGGAAPVDTNSPRSFGAENVRTTQRFATPAGQLQEIDARVTSVRPREPGVYAFTLEDGAEWLFAESVDSAYRVPRSGSVVEIERGALGSFLMRFDDQSPVAVRRVR
jgi:hypothetical protein